jgi:surface polysaccharide O-acyltransferase-like enzyme
MTAGRSSLALASSKELRHSGIDSIRIIAVFIVLLFHADFLSRESDLPLRCLHILVMDGGRWVMPFFFMVAGYFWGKKVRSTNQLTSVSLAYGSRIFRIWLFWSIVYLLVPDDINAFAHYGVSALVRVPLWRLQSLLQSPEEFFFVGARFHLWFLMALLWAVGISTLVLRYGQAKWLIWIGLGLYLFGVVAGSWSPAPFGLKIPFHTKNGPFFGTVFFVVGWLISSDRGLPARRLAHVLLWGGAAMSALEIYVLWERFGIKPTVHAYLMGTLPFGLGASLLVVSKPSMARGTAIADLGKYTLGIYVVHYLFLDLLRPLDGTINTHVWDFVFPVTVFLLSLLSVAILRQIRFLRGFVGPAS